MQRLPPEKGGATWAELTQRIRKQRRFSLRLIGDVIELWIVVAQRLGDLHFFSGEEAKELQGVDDGLRDDAVMRREYYTLGPRASCRVVLIA